MRKQAKDWENTCEKYTPGKLTFERNKELSKFNKENQPI